MNNPEPRIKCKCMFCREEKMCGYSYGAFGTIIRECDSCVKKNILKLANELGINKY